MAQIMDPKMDSGYLAEGETLDDDYDVLRDLLPEEVIGIMDQMLCFEVDLPLSRGRTGRHGSDTDARYRRWRGTWDIHFHNRCLLLSMSTA